MSALMTNSANRASESFLFIVTSSSGAGFTPSTAVHRLDERRSRHYLLFQRALEQRAVFHQSGSKEQQEDPSSPIARNVSRYFFDDYLEFGDEFLEWKEFDHPQYGKVEWEAPGRKPRAASRPGS